MTSRRRRRRLGSRVFRRSHARSVSPRVSRRRFNRRSCRRRTHRHHVEARMATGHLIGITACDPPSDPPTDLLIDLPSDPPTSCLAISATPATPAMPALPLAGATTGPTRGTLAPKGRCRIHRLRLPVRRGEVGAMALRGQRHNEGRAPLESSRARAAISRRSVATLVGAFVGCVSRALAARERLRRSEALISSMRALRLRECLSV